MEQDQIYMSRALQLAAQAVGRTSPNPLVGCVIVNNGRIVGEGYHQKAGTPHAEVHALCAADTNAQGATAYVTLEPCSHFGKTPPCADALIEAGIKRVVVAMQDPNPLVGGRGISRLRDAGIQVDVGLKEDEARSLNKGFLKAIQAELPFVLYKSALTLDGKIATESGDSKWITNEVSRAYVHQLRNQFDVIMVGSETVNHDNPALNCRMSEGRDPIRLIVDGELKIPHNADVFTSSCSAPCIIATTEAAPLEQYAFFQGLDNVEVWKYNTSRYVPYEDLFRDIVKRGWNSILLEGGGKLAGSLLQAQLIDEIEFIYAPKLIGGKGPSPLTGLELPLMSHAFPLEFLETDLSTGDLRVRAKVKYTS
ncbi:diaminohydroxyphosphoribosylaminopyrimidine deaminase [Desulfitobacterium dichloroeliminans LMG P-21439]|uniref:Riboflavin biosynthesis protein RibD n=1 Tax=Desulfitobacterium dichloroeliminans (strain LMG P-21439 / DCA1) TaxID=871963 RepID=L0F855_DESDL|nr:bifunctional diaminohydroxyphosphoribosylaminopyrimidine deaminase/5-amino-6-(5-phosphoribosylamino)uracil reductase RibD [Desulfitobacterium dichloroeliminans]AGA69377.1 diaminohydroxyphosphoribosylaminopyrimidine deaminase [Desulfitobacterium dichloroeliminans LMG P-21439]